MYTQFTVLKETDVEIRAFDHTSHKQGRERTLSSGSDTQIETKRICAGKRKSVQKNKKKSILTKEKN